MFGLSRSYMCSTCKGKFKFENIRYSTDGERIVCKDCYDKIIKELRNKETKVAQTQDNMSNSIKLVCTNCNYRFSLRRGSRMSVMCPYCGGEQLMKDDITADKILYEVSQYT